MVPKIRLGGVEGSGIFGGVAATEPGAVALVMLRKGEFEASCCGGHFGDKKRLDVH